MLKEYKRIRQEQTGFRRLFTDELYDLYIWFDDRKENRITGFQLVYKSGVDEKALTWTARGGYMHTKIDDGDKKTNQSPILVQDGLFEYREVYPELKARLGGIDRALGEFVIGKVEEYGRLYPVLSAEKN